MRNRGRIEIQPLGTSQRLRLHEQQPSPGRRLAEMDYLGKRHAADFCGWLTELPSGNYVVELVSGGIKTIDQGKAAAALDHLGERPAGLGGAEALAEELKAWRRGNAPEGTYLFEASRAAQMLGLSRRTYEGIEQGRGFRYPQLLRLALQAFKSRPS